MIFLDSLLIHGIDIVRVISTKNKFQTTSSTFLETVIVKWSTDRYLKLIVVQRLMMLILSGRIPASLVLLQLILNTSFANDKQCHVEREYFVEFFYFFVHTSR